MAYKEGDLGYIECSNCDIFYSADTDDDPCPLCDAKTLLRKIREELWNQHENCLPWIDDLIIDIDNLLGVE